MWSFAFGATVAHPNTTVIQNCSGCPVGAQGAVDFFHTTNAGSQGSLSLLSNGDARTILDHDNFAGNDNGGADGSALAIARMQPVSMSLTPGNYTVSLKGTVKGVDITASQDFQVATQINVCQ